MANVLVIDDDQMMCELLSDVARRMGHQPSYANTLKDGLEEVQSSAFDVVFLDLHLPDGNGMDIIPKIFDTPSTPEVIIISGMGDADGAERAIRSGAWDYVQKPPSLDSIKLLLVRAMRLREQKKANDVQEEEGKGVLSLKREGIIGDSPKMKRALDTLAQAANSEANVLITGETGTGKELFAMAIHENSSRASKPFVVVDCAALTESLVESVLFGHEKGAFTGADKAQEGMIKQADGGTLVLDEVGELPLSAQKAFLRVLQEHRYRSVGGKTEKQSNFRLIAATNRDLEKMVEQGQFRKDLFFRIRSLAITLPSVRERNGDIKQLAMHHMARHCERYGAGTKGLSPEFLKALNTYPWPGNVRELVHAMESALIAAGVEPLLYPDHLPVHIRIQLARASAERTPENGNGLQGAEASERPITTLQEAREAAIAATERDYLRRLMTASGANITETCRISGLSRSQLYALLKKHGITRNS